MATTGLGSSRLVVKVFKKLGTINSKIIPHWASTYNCDWTF